jgi:hypothetical protein
MTDRYRRSLRWTKADDARLDERLTELYAADAMILASKPPLEWLLEMRRVYRNIFERNAEWHPDPKVRERYRKLLAGSDERWREVQALADEMIAEHARRAEQARREVN